MLQDWNRYYGGNLLIVLPDAFGTAAFLRDAPDWVADWTGFRPDSAPPIEGGEKIIAWWQSEGQDPREKLLVFSDGLDVDTIEETYHHFQGKVRMSFGWGTNLTNDFEDCAPRYNDQPRLRFRSSARSARPMAVRLSSFRTIRRRPRAIRRKSNVIWKLFGAEDRVNRPSRSRSNFRPNRSVLPGHSRTRSRGLARPIWMHRPCHLPRLDRLLLQHNGAQFVFLRADKNVVAFIRKHNRVAIGGKERPELDTGGHWRKSRKTVGEVIGFDLAHVGDLSGAKAREFEFAQEDSCEQSFAY